MENSIYEKVEGRSTAYDESKGEAPELVIATKLLGGFRGILIDILWIQIWHQFPILSRFKNSIDGIQIERFSSASWLFCPV